VPGNLLSIPRPPVFIKYIEVSTRQSSPGNPDLLPAVLELYPLNVRERNVKKKKGGGKKVKAEEEGQGEEEQDASQEAAASDEEPNDAKPRDEKTGPRKKRRRGTNGDKASLEFLAYAPPPTPAGLIPVTTISAENPEYSAETHPVSLILEPFPTIYWLTNPSLKRAISIIEDTHLGVPTLEKRLTADDVAQMKAAHEKYAAHRLSLITEADRASIESDYPHFLAKLASTGIAGIDYRDNPGRIKCLHAHSAHYLANGPGSEDNIVGKKTIEWCRELKLIDF
jgi:hypothetical protein